MNHPTLTSGLLQTVRDSCWKWDENIYGILLPGYTGLRGKHDAIWVVVDSLDLNRPHFLPIRKITSSKLAENVQQEIVRLHGTPSAIVSDRDPRFSLVLERFTEAWGTRLKFSTTFHPEKANELSSSKDLQQADLSIWLALKIKFKRLIATNTPCKSSTICPRNQDDHHDDAHLEGENSAKRQKISEHETYVMGESSSGQANESKPGLSTSGNQEQLVDFDFWTDKYDTDC
ncbi:cold-inducible RNA-binding protein [Tanacetum coccineum]